jgi:hypothetical protein
VGGIRRFSLAVVNTAQSQPCCAAMHFKVASTFSQHHSKKSTNFWSQLTTLEHDYDPHAHLSIV